MNRAALVTTVLLVACGAGAPIDGVVGGRGSGSTSPGSDEDAGASGGQAGASGGGSSGGVAGGGVAGGGVAGGGVAGGGVTGGGVAGGGVAGGGVAGGGVAGGGVAGGGVAGGGSGAAMALAAIDAAAVGSACFRYQWRNRGQMPRGFIKGVARTFARSLCSPGRADLAVVSQAQTTDSSRDALAWFQLQYADAGMSNAQAGVETLRHVYVLLLGLGMRESSGKHCVGRDTTASNTTAATAEAGAWQTSYNSRVFSPHLDVLFARYRTDDTHCQLMTFSEGVTCSAADWMNFGTGDGFDFQKREKECPVFAAEYAAVMMRVSGGSSGHYGPLRQRAAELRPECDAMLQQVQRLVANTPAVCSLL
ncbi:MAG: hypothetical protein INH41_28560 [Myxococcaceae bacterium]|jgi:hypothetical protein|nr:hypothetical protein [Myxococcaceae bacterium]